MEFPWIIYIDKTSIRFQDCLEPHHQAIQDLVGQYGVALIRHLPKPRPSEFESFVNCSFGKPMNYDDRVTRRRLIEGHVYTATETPNHFEIPFHNERAFSQTWPRWVCFFCLTPAQSQGRTPIADVQKVYKRIPTQLSKRFEEKGVLYLRNFGVGPGMDWRTTFQVSTKEELEARCIQDDIEWEWCGKSQLRIWQRRPAVAWHPLTDSPAWFNHALALHVSTLPSSLREVLLRQLSEQDLPHHTYYGNGEKIDQDTIDVIRQAYQKESLNFSWKTGDLLVLDNLIFAHGREPFQGAREIHACLAGPMNWSNVRHSQIRKE